MILGIILTFICFLLLIPYVFSVNKINGQVVSLFGEIPRSDINKIIKQCENYYADFLEDK